jgi:hypothetical protein
MSCSALYRGAGASGLHGEEGGDTKQRSAVWILMLPLARPHRACVLPLTPRLTTLCVLLARRLASGACEQHRWGGDGERGEAQGQS